MWEYVFSEAVTELGNNSDLTQNYKLEWNNYLGKKFAV